MLACHNDLFDLKENEVMFNEICEELANHSFFSPWAPCSMAKNETEVIECAVQEFCLADIDLSNIIRDQNLCDRNSKEKATEILLNHNLKEAEFKEEKFLFLKTSLLSVHDTHLVEHVKDIDLLNSLSLSQIPKFCEFLQAAFFNESSVALFLNAILTLEKPLSITVASALINHVVYPKLVSLKSSKFRNLSLSILNVFETYPKAIIDEVLIPCLKKEPLETTLQEILLKVVKSTMPNEYVAYSIKSILENALPTDKTFLILQTLIEKKIPFEDCLHSALAFTLASWTTTSNTNVKFTKLIISIVSIYGDKLSEQQIKIYTDSIHINSTIMKKAAENVLKRLKM